MNPLPRLVSVLCLGLFGILAVQAQPATNPAAVPVIRNTWLDRHNGFVQEARKGGVDVLFVGDSITDGWRGAGKTVWAERFGPLKAANFGIGGDRTEHVLWRLQNGSLEGIQPKVVVLMIGTNNSGRDSAPQIAEGITAIVKEIQTRLPATKVLILGVFPRGDKAGTPTRLKLAAVNEIVAKLDDGKQVFFLDIGEKFLQPDGTLTREIMPDLLHLSPAGYTIWADSIQAKLTELLK